MAHRQTKTIFISSRRSVSQWSARAVYQYFRKRGHDVFYDIGGMPPGDFETPLLTQIARRDHFLLLLAPGTLDRCREPGDWLRREIEHAIDTGRNIVPLLFEGFEFNTVKDKLTGKLAELEHYAGVRMFAAQFEDGMQHLDTQYLVAPVATAAPHPITAAEQQLIDAARASADAKPEVTVEHLMADEYLALSYVHGVAGRFDEAIAAVDTAIRLNPEHATAYANRGLAYINKGDLDRALADFNRAIEIAPIPVSLRNRADAYRKLGNIAAAEADEREAARLESLA